jgi:hypothetical protein
LTDTIPKRQTVKQAREAADAAIKPLVLAAQSGDKAALDLVWEASVPVARRVASLYTKKYEWIDLDDLSSDLLLSVPRFVESFSLNHSSGTGWLKYCYHRFHFLCKDILRREDPLGIKWPQKKAYPSWHRLGDESLQGYDAPGKCEQVSIDEQIDDRSHLEQLTQIASDCRSLLKEIAPRKFSEKTGRMLCAKRPPRHLKQRKAKAKNKSSSFKTFIQNRRKNRMENPHIEHEVLTPESTSIVQASYSQPESQPQPAPAVAKPQVQTQQPAAAQQPPAPVAATPQPAVQPPAAKPDKWTPARRRRHEANKAAGLTSRKPSKPASRRPQPSRSKPKQPASKELTATELIVLASRFVEAAGGCSRAASLIEQLSQLKK